MKKIIMAIVVFGCAASIVGCGPKRWIKGDPRDATPVPTPVVIDSVEIGVSTSADKKECITEKTCGEDQECDTEKE